MIAPHGGKNELIRLVERVLQGKATPEETLFIEQYYDYFDKEAFDPASLSSADRKRLEDTILQRIKEKMEPPEEKKISSIFRNRLLRVAAASAALLLASGAFFIYRHHHLTDIAGRENQAVQQDRPPGGNKAVLVLANGKRIILANARNGTLGTTGNSRIVKISSGQLAFHSQPASGRSPGKKSSPDVRYNTLHTPRGGTYEVTLSDGTKVWLNSASSLRFPTAFEGPERVVALTGEAYFEVVEDKDQPFRVEVGSMEVRDLGTHFNIMAYGDEPAMTTTLLEGAVSVRKDDEQVMLRPGQQSVIPDGADGKIKVEPADTESSIAWKNGFFTFHGTSIYEIMRQLSRWYDVDVSFRDSVHVFLNGNIGRDVNVSEVFKLLELTGELHFTIAGKKVLVEKQ